MASEEREDDKGSIFGWSDPRQAQIYEDLLFIGEGPAEFFRDACRLMADAAGEACAAIAVNHGKFSE